MAATTESDEPIRIAFTCVQNAGRSQIATAFAEHERDRRGLEDRVAILTGGTHPAPQVHDGVVDMMDDAGFDLTDRTPREITLDELQYCDYVATMGCSTLDVGEVGEDVDVRDWALEDPADQAPERVREIRDEIERRVIALFDELTTLRAGAGEAGGSSALVGRLLNRAHCTLGSLTAPFDPPSKIATQPQEWIGRFELLVSIHADIRCIGGEGSLRAMVVYGRLTHRGDLVAVVRECQQSAPACLQGPEPLFLNRRGFDGLEFPVDPRQDRRCFID